MQACRAKTRTGVGPTIAHIPRIHRQRAAHDRSWMLGRPVPLERPPFDELGKGMFPAGLGKVLSTTRSWEQLEASCQKTVGRISERREETSRGREDAQDTGNRFYDLLGRLRINKRRYQSAQGWKQPSESAVRPAERVETPHSGANWVRGKSPGRIETGRRRILDDTRKDLLKNRLYEWPRRRWCYLKTSRHWKKPQMRPSPSFRFILSHVCDSDEERACCEGRKRVENCTRDGNQWRGSFVLYTSARNPPETIPYRKQDAWIGKEKRGDRKPMASSSRVESDSVQDLCLDKDFPRRSETRLHKRAIRDPPPALRARSSGNAGIGATGYSNISIAHNPRTVLKPKFHQHNCLTGDRRAGQIFSDGRTGQSCSDRFTTVSIQRSSRGKFTAISPPRAPYQKRIRPEDPSAQSKYSMDERSLWRPKKGVDCNTWRSVPVSAKSGVRGTRTCDRSPGLPDNRETKRGVACLCQGVLVDHAFPLRHRGRLLLHVTYRPRNCRTAASARLTLQSQLQLNTTKTNLCRGLPTRQKDVDKALALEKKKLRWAPELAVIVASGHCSRPIPMEAKIFR
ncbi:hypothetical protein F5148DRAFT_1150187 [Russula earlei]|uniref:Uncharacterized protein n=1 Tax=Russula earlei TaxID=71964 RepID=A0ACC0U7N5_9AGAM|nr:hypothetical protein F5148DRAFT_1150187 [Russula earlei]